MNNSWWHCSAGVERLQELSLAWSDLGVVCWIHKREEEKTVEKGIRLRRWRKFWRRSLIGFGICLLVSVTWATVLYNRDAPVFAGSPPAKCDPQRSDVDLNHDGWFAEKFFKTYRTSSWLEPGPGLIVFNICPIHGLTGFDRLNEAQDSKPVLPCEPKHNPGVVEPGTCHCVIGKASQLHISEGDGDFNILVTLEGKFQYLADVSRWHWWSPDLVIRDPDMNDASKLVTEIDYPLRKNFPILSDLRNGDRVKICGSWVFDRSHPHNEIHPITWLEILNPYTCTGTVASAR